MEIYLFFSETDTTVFGFSLHADGVNLPVELAPWSQSSLGALYTHPEAGFAAIWPANPVVREVLRDGFYLGRITSR